MNFSTLKSEAKRNLSNNYSNYILVNLIYEGIIGAASAYYGASIFLIVPMTIGLFYILVKGTRNEEYSIGDLFKGFKNYLNAMCLGLLMTLYTFLWSLLFIIPGIIKGISYSFAPYLMLLNPEIEPTEAIKQSKELTYNHKWEIFCLYISFLGWIILSCFTFGILYILYVGPYIKTTFVLYYRKLLGDGKLATKYKETII